jgi:hypothetical protein
MASCEQDAAFATLDLPDEFRELEGLLEADLHAIVTMLTQRAHERLFLTRREHRELQAQLWNGLTDVLSTALQPLSVEHR